MIADQTFATRLRLARQLLARGPSPMPVHLADQLDAASAEVREAHDRLGAVLPILAPDRTWHRRVERAPSDETRAYLLAGVLGSRAYCLHLRRGGPQPAFVRLPLRRADCARCVQTTRRSLTAEDECDLCGTRGVAMFHPFACRQGPALIAGDACRACAGVLGIVAKKVGARWLSRLCVLPMLDPSRLRASSDRRTRRSPEDCRHGSAATPVLKRRASCSIATGATSRPSST